eukprot:1859700-Prymnesium_polylepis.1
MSGVCVARRLPGRPPPHSAAGLGRRVPRCVSDSGLPPTATYPVLCVYIFVALACFFHTFLLSRFCRPVQLGKRVAEPADIDLLAALECAQALDQEDLEMILRRQPDDERIASRDRQLAEDLQAED